MEGKGPPEARKMKKTEVKHCALCMHAREKAYRSPCKECVLSGNFICFRRDFQEPFRELFSVVVRELKIEQFLEWLNRKLEKKEL